MNTFKNQQSDQVKKSAPQTKPVCHLSTLRVSNTQEKIIHCPLSYNPINPSQRNIYPLFHLERRKGPRKQTSIDAKVFASFLKSHLEIFPTMA